VSLAVIVGAGHAGHAPLDEVQGGVALPAFDQPTRIDAIVDALGDADVELMAPQPHGAEPALALHDPGLVDFITHGWERLEGLRPDGARAVFADTFAHAGLRRGLEPEMRPGAGAGAMGWWCFDTITGLQPGTGAAALEAVDTALTGAALLDERREAVALARPPGHHVTRDLFGGGCFLNNAAIAAEQLVRRGDGAVAVLDLDFHHGNGTQSLFFERSDVHYVSLHGAPEHHYPFHVGFPEERGAGAGEGANHNLVLPEAVDGAAYLRILAHGLELVSAAAPSALVVSLGLDVVPEDPSSDARVERDDLARAGREVGSLGLPTLVVLEGGYAVDRLGADMRAWLEGFIAARAA
jgi:acetoin utilization deacetylase AcuC-like enzyme